VPMAVIIVLFVVVLVVVVVVRCRNDHRGGDDDDGSGTLVGRSPIGATFYWRASISYAPSTIPAV
jgi:heme/copper-type cytochrome/quinol oxidase subunit 2